MTQVVGVTVRIKAGRPHLCGVLMETVGEEVVSRTFEHLSSKGLEAEDQLHALSQALASELKAQKIAAGAIREAGFARGTGLNARVKNRLRAEGIALSLIRVVTDKVVLTDNQGLARIVGVPASEIDRRGEQVVGGAWADAASAAIAARALV